MLAKGQRVRVVVQPLVGEILSKSINDGDTVDYLVEFDRDGEKVQRHFKEDEIEVVTAESEVAQ